MLTFAYIWVFAFLPLPWLLRAVLPVRRSSEIAVRVPFGDRLKAAGEIGAPATRAAKGLSRQLFSSVLWLLILIAAARPQWVEPPVVKGLPTRDLLLLVDLSGSMNQEDFTNAEGKTVDRLTAVKEVAGDFLEHREGDRVGLVVFGDAAFLQAPFSNDLSLSRRLLDETAIGMAGPRTAFGDAIGLGVGLFDESDVPAKTIIALTDGNDTKSQLPPAEAARVAAQRGICIHTVAIGDPTTVGEEKLDEVALNEVAQTTGGKYFFAADREALAGIYEELDRIETREVKTISHVPRRDIFQWPVLAALLLSLVGKLIHLRGRARESALGSTAVHVNPLTGKLEVLG